MMKRLIEGLYLVRIFAWRFPLTVMADWRNRCRMAWHRRTPRRDRRWRAIDTLNRRLGFDATGRLIAEAKRLCAAPPMLEPEDVHRLIDVAARAADAGGDGAAAVREMADAAELWRAFLPTQSVTEAR